MTVPEPDRDLNREEAFCLRIVLAKERVKREQLSTIIDTLDRVLGRLSRAGLVTVEDDIVELVPAAVPAAAATATERGGYCDRAPGSGRHRDRPGDAHENGRRTRSRVPGHLVVGSCSRRSPSAFPADGSASRLLFRSRGFSSSEPRRIWSWDRCSDYRPHSCSQCRDCSGRLWGSA